MFSHVDALGGFTLPEVALPVRDVRARPSGSADLAARLDRTGSAARVRDGTLDTLLVRPVPVLAQVAADRFALRRLGRIAQGLAVLGWALLGVDVDWTPVKVLLMPVMVRRGAAIFAAVFVAGAAFQFRGAGRLRGAELLHVRRQRRCCSTRRRSSAKDLVRGVTFVVPLAFVNWLPALYVLGRPDPLGLPAWAGLRVAAGGGGVLRAGRRWRGGRAFVRTGARGVERHGDAGCASSSWTGSRRSSTCAAGPGSCAGSGGRCGRWTAISFTRGARRDGRLHRAERRREVHDDQDAHRHPHPERRPAAGGGHRPVPGAHAAGAADRGGVRAAYDAVVGPAADGLVPADAPHVPDPGRAVPGEPGPLCRTPRSRPSCWTCRCGSCRWGSGCAGTSRRRCCTIPRCCTSTSRRSGWT